MDEISAVLICSSGALKEKGKGVRFPVSADGEERSGFVVRFQDSIYGYLNRCAHVPIELDWNEGEFFETTGLYLMCSTHGALYAPENGKCLGGPCRKGKLRPIKVFERENQIFWQPDDYIKPIEHQPKNDNDD